jgi:hypothetical protein
MRGRRCSATGLAEEVDFDLRAGGEASFRSQESVKTGWVEEVLAPVRLAFWWGEDGEPASRVELTLTDDGSQTRLRVIETRPLEVLELVGLPLPRAGGRTFGPALIAA